MPTIAGTRIFLSYRRDDSQHLAGRLADRLVQRFGRPNVFVDVDSIRPGDDYVERTREAVSRSTALVAIIGPRWTDVTDAQGRRRLDEANDVVVLEIATALRWDVPIIPVLVDGATMPDADELPAALAPLSFRNAVSLDATTFGPRVDALIRRLEELAPRRATPRRTAVAGAVAAAIVLVGVVATPLFMGPAGDSGDPEPAPDAADFAGCEPIVDDFDDELDRDVWTVLNEDTSRIRTSDGALVIDTSGRDFWRDGRTPVNLVLRPVSGQHWTARAEIEADLRGGYQQAGVLAYRDDDNYAKVGVAADPFGTRLRFFYLEENGRIPELRPEVSDEALAADPRVATGFSWCATATT